MKKSKLIMSIATLCLAIAVLCFGVYAVQTLNYSLSGNITYEVIDAFVEVQTKVYSSPELMSGPQMLDKAYELGDADFNASETYTGLSFVKSIGKYSSVSDGNSFEDNTLDLTLNQDAKTYFVVINVKNLSSEINVWAVINDAMFNLHENVLERDNAIQQNIGLLNADTDNKNIVIALSIKDQTKPIQQDSTFKFGIKVGTGDYSQTLENLNKLTFEENIPGETYQVTGVASNSGGVLIIPKTYNNLPVDYIMEDQSLDGFDTTISTIIINAQLNSIGMNTFFCFENNLHTVIFPNTLQDIGDFLFDSCFNVEHIYVPDGDGTPFTSFYNGKEVDAIINETTKALVVGCNGTKFESLDGITSIHNYAFYECRSLTTIEIPKSVTSIEGQAFKGCSSVKSITVQNGNTEYVSEGNCLIERRTNALILGCNSSVIPAVVTDIGSSAFEDCVSLTSVTIPGNVTAIGNRAFYNCTSLVSVTIENGVTSIGQEAFSDCTSLTSITIPRSVTNIGFHAFDSCTNLTKIKNDSTSITSYMLPTISGKSWYFEDGTAVTEITKVGTYNLKQN